MICVSSETVNEDLNKLRTEVSRLETENSKHRAQVETLRRKLDQGSMKFSGDTASISSDRVLTNMQQELSKLGRRLHVKERQDAKDSFYSLVNFILLVVLVVVSAGISIWQSRDIMTQTNEIRRSVNEINQREFQNQARESGEEEPVDSNVGVASETCVDTSDNGPCEDEDGSQP